MVQTKTCTCMWYILTKNISIFCMEEYIVITYCESSATNSFSFSTTTRMWVFLRTYELVIGRFSIEVILYWPLSPILLSHSLPAHPHNKSNEYWSAYTYICYMLWWNMSKHNIAHTSMDILSNHRVYYLTRYLGN